MEDDAHILPELSWLSFNARVLQEAEDPSIPLKNRLRFLGIYSNNRDEFFRKPRDAIKELVQLKDENQKRFKGKIPKQSLERIYHIVIDQQRDFNRIWENIKRELKEENFIVVDDKSLTAKQEKIITHYFDQELSSSITPLMLDAIPKWPSYEDESIFLGIAMRKTESSRFKFAIIEIPTKSFPRFILLPAAKGKQAIILLEDLIRYNLPRIFGGMGFTYFEAHMFKVTKDGEFNLDDDISTSLVQKIEKAVKNRRRSTAISFLYDNEMNKGLLKYLIKKLNLSPKNILIPGGKIRNFRDFINFPFMTGTTTHRKQKIFKHPAFSKSSSIRDVIKHKDVLLHFPYHAFSSIVDLLKEAAVDPHVVSIKITAYRLAENSTVCNALINAARAGKQVHVVIELRAYFSEKANLEWQRKLEDEGIKVFVGLPKMKVHAKLGLITRTVGKRVFQYGFVGTGNLNEKTAQHYTDLYLLTCNKAIMADVERVFKALENPSKNWYGLNKFKTLLISPVFMRQAIAAKINREIKNAQAGQMAKMTIVVNSLSDPKLIKLLYKAAEAGVKIRLVVRGIFCVEMDRKELNANMKAISIVDEYLEHSRIWIFYNGGNQEIFIASADWNERNLDRRIEIAVPIFDEDIQAELRDIVKIKLNDTVKARVLDKGFSNQYVPCKGKKRVQSQIAIYKYLKKRREKK